MAYIELNKDVVIKACNDALNDVGNDLKLTYDSYVKEGLTKKTFFTRRSYTLEEAKQYANNQMMSDEIRLFANFSKYDLRQLKRTAECAEETIHLTDNDVKCIAKYLKS